MRRIMMLIILLGLFNTLNAVENVAASEVIAAAENLAASEVIAGELTAENVAAFAATAESATAEIFAGAKKLYDAGNFADALPLLEQVLLAPNCEFAQTQQALQWSFAALQKLNRVHEIDAFLEKIVGAQKDNWQVLMCVAEFYYNGMMHTWGAIIDGVFKRGQHGGQSVNYCRDRDRVRALQMMQAAQMLLEKNPLSEKATLDAKLLRADFYRLWAHLWFNRASDPRNAWRLQILTAINTLPDYVTQNDFHAQNNEARGAPILPNGQPVLYYVPADFATAKNDGERWRWCLAQAKQYQSAPSAEFALSSFCDQQFGVQTLSTIDFSHNPKVLENVLALHTLQDNEMIAQLANGIARFTLPDEFAPIIIWKKIYDAGNTVTKTPNSITEDGSSKALAADSLAGIYQSRRQYNEAVKWYKLSAEARKHPQHAERQLAQLTGNFAEFEVGKPLPSGAKSVALLKFRNAKKITFHARKIKVKELLNDTMEYIRQHAGKRQQGDYEKMDVNNIGQRLVYGNEKIYIGEEVATWEMDLTEHLPKLAHHTSMVRVELPENLPTGGYLLEGKVDDGNTARLVIWLANTAIVKKNIDGKVLYYVADATTGAPRAQQKLTAWGYAVHWQDEKLGNKFYEKNLSGVTDENGCVTFTNDDVTKKTDVNLLNLQWLITTTYENTNIHAAYLGFTGMWANDGNRDDDYKNNEVKTFLMTDRPLYRPNDKVQIKGWIRNPNYVAKNANEEINPRYEVSASSAFDEKNGEPVLERGKRGFTNADLPLTDKKLQLIINSPSGEKAHEIKNITLDEFGGFTAEYILPADAKLGAWNFEVREISGRYFGNGTFRVEEYQKPEYEVTVDAPREPVALGEKITATVKAKYYFGENVKNANVQYKVFRHIHTTRWFPPFQWDWLYGNGYGWLAENYEWFPGWARWGCARPIFAWWGNYERTLPPELVSENTAPLNADGELKIEIDTASAKLLHPDLDHRYEIQVAVTDESRRIIDGRGNVLVAKKPLTITAWTNRGFYDLNSNVNLFFKAQTLDNKPIAQTTGELKIFKVQFIDDEFKETEIKNEKITTDKNGDAHYEFIPETAGQYRAEFTLPSHYKQELLERGKRGFTNADNADKEIDKEINPRYAVSASSAFQNSVAEISGGCLFTIRGVSGEIAAAQFNPLEIIPEKTDYQIGDVCRLQINTANPDATVLLFLRSANNISSAPEILRVKNRSTVYEFIITERDIPNFFVEAITVYDAQIHNVMRQIAVPPANKILTLTILPEKTQLKPAEKSKLTLRLTDENGQPFRGQAVLTMYDKSLEYISGGTNVPEIHKYFWGWLRSNYPQVECNLRKSFYNLLKKDERGMEPLSLFDMLAAYYTDDGRKVPMKSETKRHGGPMKAKNGNVVMLRTRDAAAPMLMDEAVMDAGVGYSSAEPVGEKVFALPQESSGNALIAIGGKLENTPTAPVTIRSNFADTALWRGVILTDENGEAKIDFTLPETLTTWKIRAWAMGKQTEVAQAECEIITFKNLLLRLQSPRFLIVGDNATFSANIHNYLPTEQTLNAEISLNGTGLNLAENNGAKKIVIPAGGEQRVDWKVTANAVGESEIIMRALGIDESDAVKITLPVHVHGIDKMIAQSGVLPQNKTEATLDFTIPEKRRVNETRLEIRYSPTLAMAMIDALPYLIQYPHGCTEQTLNKFLPLVITQNTLKKLNINLADVKNKITNLNAQEIGDDQKRAEQWKKSRTADAVFDEKIMTEYVEYGVKRLTAMQCNDGGWGWFSGYGEYSFPHTTAIVVRGLLLARENGALIPGTIIDRGIQWLKNYQAEQTQLLQTYIDWQNALKQNDKTPAPPKYKSKTDNLDALIYCVLAQAEFTATPMREFLMRDRAEFSVYGKALLGLGFWFNLQHTNDLAQKADLQEQINEVLKNLSQHVVENEENQTAYLNLNNDHCWWYWYGSEIETLAIYLKLLANMSPQNPLTSKFVKYLINNRKHATYWQSTRDTALVIEAFADYLAKTNEAQPQMTVSVLVDGKPMKEVKIDSENLFTFDNKVVLSGAELSSGKCNVEIRRNGTGTLYFNAYLSYFSLEDNITSAGVEIKSVRRVYRLSPTNTTQKVADAKGQIAEQGQEKYDKILLKSNDAIKSGDLLEVELILTSANDYEYLIFSDHKPAGCEPVDVRSGYNDNALGAYIEFRTATVDFFIRQLKRGTYSLTYRTRAIYPGTYSALPTLGSAMYAPELRCNSDEIKLQVVE